jgi:hypothetical protein
MIGIDGNFYWWFGVVEDRNDPLKLGQVKVRIFGLHTPNRAVLPTDQLPWAYPIQPITSAANSGVGGSPTGPVEGTVVFGFFRDGPNMQEPAIIGTIGGQPTFAASPQTEQTGFYDPNGVYPKQAGLNDAGLLASGVVTGSPIDTSNQTTETDLPVGLIDTVDVPQSVAAPIYPFNHTYTSESGHFQEFDDTPGKERIRTQHKSGTFTEIGPDGTRITRVVTDDYEVTLGNKTIYVKGNAAVTADGNIQISCKGSAEVVVGGNAQIKVAGDFNVKAGGRAVIASEGDMILWSGSHLIMEAPFIDYAPDGGVSPNELAPIMDQTAVDHAVQADDPVADPTPINPGQYQKLLNRSGASAPPQPTGDEDTAPAPSKPNPAITPSDITMFDDTTELAFGYTVGNMSSGAVFPHSIVAQHNLTELQIVDNLRQVVINCVKPMADHFGANRIQINSAFRAGTSTSQHELGQAVDIQIPGFSSADYFTAATWVRDNIVFDQFIIEFGGIKPWFHLSFDPNKTAQRNMVLTRTSPGVYKPGLIQIV